MRYGALQWGKMELLQVEEMIGELLYGILRPNNNCGKLKSIKNLLRQLDFHQITKP